MSDKIELIGLSKEELQEHFKSLGEPAFRAKQIWQWVYFYGKTDYRRGIGAFVQTIHDTEDPIHQSYYGAGYGNIYKLKWVTVDSIG